MNDLIDRYVYDVTRRLPKNNRIDVEKELSANIEDMISENPTDDDVLVVLTSLGDPAKLSEQYRSRPRYLISPAIFDDYIAILKLVIGIVVAVMIAIGLINNLINYSGDVTIIKIFVTALVSIITGAFTGIVNAFLWVTVVFALLDYLNIKRNKKEWSPKNLPEMPSSSGLKISRGETIADISFSIVFNVLFILAIIRYPHVLACYKMDGGLTPVVPLFNEVVLQKFFLFFIILAVFSLVIAVAKLYCGQWNYPLAVLNAIYDVAGAVVGILLLRNFNTFNQDFIRHFADAISSDFATVSFYWHRGIIIIMAFIVVITVGDIVLSFYKVCKNQIFHK